MQVVQGQTAAGSTGVWSLTLLAGETTTSPQEAYYFYYGSQLQAIRMGDWKLHEYFEDGALLLFNLKDDIRERNNLAQTHPEQCKQLHDVLVSWREEIGAPVPNIPNPTFDSAAEAKAARKALQNNGNR